MNAFLHTLTDNWDIFSRGFVNTIKLFLVSGVCALILGTLLGAARVSPVPPCGASAPGTSASCATPR